MSEQDMIEAVLRPVLDEIAHYERLSILPWEDRANAAARLRYEHGLSEIRKKVETHLRPRAELTTTE